MKDEEIGALLLYFRNNGQRRDELILWVFYACALRPGELFALRWNDWDADDSDQLRIDEAFGKSGLDDPKTPSSDSYVHLPPGVQALLREWKAWCGNSRPEAFIFPSRTSRIRCFAGRALRWRWIRVRRQKMFKAKCGTPMLGYPSITAR